MKHRIVAFTSIFMILVSDKSVTSLKGSCDYTKTFSRCGVSSGGSYLVFCGLDISVGPNSNTKLEAKLVTCTGDSNGDLVDDTRIAGYSTPTGRTYYSYPVLCEAPVTITSNCCGGARTSVTSTFPWYGSGVRDCIFGF